MKKNNIILTIFFNILKHLFLSVLFYLLFGNYSTLITMIIKTLKFILIKDYRKTITSQTILFFILEDFIETIIFQETICHLIITINFIKKALLFSVMLIILR